MTDAERDHTKVVADPASTWGATPEAKSAWERKYGAPARKAAEKANKDDDK